MSAVEATTGRKVGDTAIEKGNYIKLGVGGEWERECITGGVIRIGFETQDKEVFDACLRCDWASLKRIWLKEGKKPGTATTFTNQTRQFFEDTGSTLWVTFYNRRLYWCFLDSDTLPWQSDTHGAYRRTRCGWSCEDLRYKRVLFKNNLSGMITKKSMFLGTICSLNETEIDYLVHRINGELLPSVADASHKLTDLELAILKVIRLLLPEDFELLVGLLFSTSGWRRVSAIGGNEKTTDMDLELPITGWKAFVQVKSATTQEQFDDYLGKLESEGTNGTMFYVYHSGTVVSGSSRVQLIGPERLAKMVVNAGLTQWVIDKIS